MVAPTIGSVFDSLLIVTHIVGFCNCSMFCCALLYDHSSFAIILMGRELVALLSLSSWCSSLPQGAMGLSAVCDCGIFLSCSLTILVLVLLVCTVCLFTFFNILDGEK